MSIGGQAASQNQQGQQNSQFGGVQDSTTGTTQNQTGSTASTGTQTGQTAGTQTGQSTATPTAGFGSVSDLLQGLISGNSGLTPQQLAAMGINTDAAQNYSNASDYGGSVLSNYVGDNHPAYQIADAKTVVAPQASTFIDSYNNPYQQQVVDATRNDLTQGFKTGLNELRASYGGQYGNGREGVAAGTAADQFDRTLGTTLGNLRSQGFTTALAPAQQDASNQLAANTNNVTNQIGVDQFNTAQKNLNDNQSINVINDWIAQQGAKANALTGAANTNAATSQGGLGNLFGFLNSQTPAFGQTNTGTTAGSTTGTTASQTDTTLQNIVNSILHGTSSGTSSGSSSGSGSSKGGGATIPII